MYRERPEESERVVKKYSVCGTEIVVRYTATVCEKCLPTAEKELWKIAENERITMMDSIDEFSDEEAPNEICDKCGK